MLKIIFLLFFVFYTQAESDNFINIDNGIFALSVIKDSKVVSREIVAKENKNNIINNKTFSLNSMSKQFTAAAILILEERGLLSINDKINTFFPEITKIPKEATILHLITHSAGIPDYLNDPFLNMDTFAKQEKRVDYNYVIEYINKNNFKQLGIYNYSNSGYVLLGRIVEIVSGMSLSKFLQKNIFSKLQMNNTYINHTKGKNRCMQGYTAWPIFSEKERDSVLFTIGDLGICSTLADYEKWIIAIEKGDIFINKDTAIKFLEKVKLQDGNIVSMAKSIKFSQGTYGYGWRHAFYKGIYPIIWHQGILSGSTSCVVYFVDYNTWVIFFSNANIAEMPDFIIDKSFKILKPNDLEN